MWLKSGAVPAALVLEDGRPHQSELTFVVSVAEGPEVQRGVPG